MPLPDLAQRTLGSAMERALAVRPDAPALRGRDGEWTFAQSYERALVLAGGLQRHGMGRAEPVALLLDNHVDFVHLWWGIVLAGAIEVPVNTAYKGTFLAHILNDSGARILVVDEAYAERIARIADDVTHLETVIVRGDPTALERTRFTVRPLTELAHAAPPAQPVAAGPGDLHALMYTSGTTGPSKGVQCPHAHAYTYASREDGPPATISPEDRILAVLPIFHLAGQWFEVYQALIGQCLCVIEPGFSLSAFWPTVREHGITKTCMLGTIAELLQQQPPAPDDADNPMRWAVMAPLPTNAGAFAARFGVEVVPAYGMSEIGLVLIGDPDHVTPGEAGLRRDGYELRLVDDDLTDVADGEIGQLLVSPELPHTVMAGYHGRPEQTAQTLRDGWVHTGDAMRRRNGHYFFADRIKDALRRRGENISSYEVETAINAHPAVAESAVVAAPSELAEDEVKAVVVLREGHEADPRALTEFLIDALPYFMVPRYVVFADALPKTPTQKVRKVALREQGLDGAWDREAAGIRLRRGD